MRSDSGGMTSKAVQRRLTKAGIVSEFTCPYIPEQNGVVKRLNRIIDDIAATMLSFARLLEQFWKEASALATLILNIAPCKDDNNFQIDSF